MRTLILAIFTLPFVEENLFRCIATNGNLAFGKDAAYDVLRGCQSNWRSCCCMSAPTLRFLNRLTAEIAALF